MTFAFDLISDLHIETWDTFDWTGQPTSPYCVVAGDVSRDPEIVAHTLKHLGECYQGGVFYIDGNDEHRNSLDNLGESYKTLTRSIRKIKNVVYMQDNVIIINGVALLATNGWWSYDFDDALDPDQTMEWYRDRMSVTESSALSINSVAYNDAAYMINSVAKLQTHQDVKSIVIISHTVPAPWLIHHDTELADTWRFNCMGNKHLQLVLNEDTENKIHTWCFGHYHKSVDRTLDNIRYVNNCRGRGNTDWRQVAYYPKRITVEI
jgi:UDP-2,3-diacylglucosamine pyrophosphatase LpxH